MIIYKTKLLLYTELYSVAVFLYSGTVDGILHLTSVLSFQ